MFTENSSADKTYDSLLLFTYGGPEGMAEVAPFLDHVLSGKTVSPERRAEVEKHYAAMGGVSPINRHSRELLAMLRTELLGRGITLPIYWGCRHSSPMVADVLREMAEEGRRRTLVFVPSPFGGFFSDDVYRVALEKATGENTPRCVKLPPFYDRAGFIAAQRAVMEEILQPDAAVMFTAHSVPRDMPDTAEYVRQVDWCVERITTAGNVAKHSDRIVPLNQSPLLSGHCAGASFPAVVAWQSAAGVAWLTPDVKDVLRHLSAIGKKHVVAVPVGFPLENMEVVYDLDVEAREFAEQHGMSFRRAKTVGTHPEFIRMAGEMIAEAVSNTAQRTWGVFHV